MARGSYYGKIPSKSHSDENPQLEDSILVPLYLA
jgi:hypothetical protein